MGTFTHHPDGYVVINGTNIDLAEFMIEEPGYTLPATGAGRQYDGSTDRCYTADYVSEFDGAEGAILDGYIAKLATYLANISERRELATDTAYAGSLATAKTVRKQALKAEAVAAYRAYADSDLEVTQANKDTYRAALIAEKPTVVAEIDALTTIRDVRNYTYNNWPATP